MSPRTREAKKQAKARPRRRLTAQERLARERRQAQQAAQALEQALEGLGVPAELVAEIEGRLCSQHKLLGKFLRYALDQALGENAVRRSRKGL